MGAVRFFTDTGLEVPAVSAAQMRRVDSIAIEECGPNLYQMMENAGRSLAEHVTKTLRLPGSRCTVVVLAGSGGNGGGGICAARHLANHGVRVRLCLAAPDVLAPVSKWQLHVFRGTDGEEVDAEALRSAPYDDVVVDALIGYGLNAAPRGTTADLITWANASGKPIIALDVPSGIDATTGEAPGDAIVAAETLTLGLPKTGLVGERPGQLFLADIGIPIGVYRRAGIFGAGVFDGRLVVPLTAVW